MSWEYYIKEIKHYLKIDLSNFEKTITNLFTIIFNWFPMIRGVIQERAELVRSKNSSKVKDRSDSLEIYIVTGKLPYS